jgi:UDP-N-acetylglucosamine 3-dehydrogenase
VSKVPSVLLVGVGRWGENHLRVWQKLDAEGLCNFIGVLDSEESRRQMISDKFGVKTFSDDSAFSQADAIDVVVPTYNHFDVVRKALSMGRDVLVEKPITATLEQALELQKIQQKSSQILMVGHLFKYNPALELTMKLLDDGEIGKVRYLRARFMGFRDKEHDAGVLATTAIHFIYVSNHIMGKDPKSVRANADFLLDGELDDHCFIRLDYDSGFSMIESDYFTPGKYRTIDIIGTNGSIVLDMLSQTVELRREWHVKNGTRFNAYDGGVIPQNIEFKEPLYLELSHFLDCIRTRNEPLTGIKDGIETLKIIEAAYKSAKLDETVKL